MQRGLDGCCGAGRRGIGGIVVGHIYTSVDQLIGHTPLLELKRVEPVSYTHLQG